jgi:hypothetical protein
MFFVLLSPEHLSEFRKKKTGMDKDKIACIGYSVAGGIVIGIIIGWFSGHLSAGVNIFPITRIMDPVLKPTLS